MVMDLYIKDRQRKKGEFQFFMHQFVESAVRLGIGPKKEFARRMPFRYRMIKAMRHFLKMSHGIGVGTFSKSIIITSNGRNLFHESFPYYRYQIIPMLWDVWPYCWDTLYEDLKLLKCKTVFVTVREIAEKISTDLGIKAYWIPEGIDIKDYDKGKNLAAREIDVYELGRQKQEYDTIVKQMLKTGGGKIFGS